MPQTDQRADVGATSSSYSTATTSGTSSTTAVTQPAGNAAALEDAGLATGSLTPEDEMLGDMVAGMLAYLPLGSGLALAWDLRKLEQMRQWLAGVDMAAVAEEAPDFLMSILDKVFPDGSSLTTGLTVEAAAALTGGAESGYTLEREGSTLSYTLRGQVDVGAAIAAGGEMKGAGGSPLAEAMAELGCSQAAEIEATWELPIGDTVVPETLYRCALDLEQLEIKAFCRDVGAAVDVLLATARPVALAIHNSVSVTAEAGMDVTSAVVTQGALEDTGLFGLEQSGELEAGVSTGYDADGAYVEVSASGSGEVQGWLGISTALDALGCHLGDIVGKLGLAVRVRAQAPTEVIKAAVESGFTNTSGISFLVGITKTIGGATTEEVATIDSISGVASYFSAAAAQAEDPADVFDAWETCPADASGSATIPDVSLERSMTIELKDADAADNLLPGWAEAAADLLPDHGVVTGVKTRSLEGRVHVGSDAVVALMGDPTYAIAPTEEDVIALERILLDGAVATASTGGLATTPWAGRDLSRVADLVHFDSLELIAEVTFEAGAGGKAGEGAKVELEGNASMTLSRRMEVTGQTQAELAEKLS